MIGSGALAFIGPDGNVWTMEAGTGSKRRITLDGTPDSPYGPPAWSRDGRQLLSPRRDPPALVTVELPEYRTCLVPTVQPPLAAWGPGAAEITLAVPDEAGQVIRVEVLWTNSR